MFLITDVFYSKVRTFCRLQVMYENKREKKTAVVLSLHLKELNFC